MIFTNNVEFDFSQLGSLDKSKTYEKLSDKPIPISQSLIKDLNKETGYCPRRLKESYINGIRMDAVPNTAMHKGICFEYFFNGSVGVGGVIPTIPKKGKGEGIPVDYERLQEQAEFFKDTIFPYYGFEIYDQDVELSTEFIDSKGQLPHPITVRGRLDIIGIRDGKPCIIDLKATGEIDNGFSQNAWKSPSTLDHTQAYLYMWLYARNKEVNPAMYIPDFYYMVAEWGPKKDYELIKVEWSSVRAGEIEQTIIQGYNKMLELKEQGWPEVPSFYECKDCPIKNACAKRKSIKDIKLVQ